MDDIFDKKREVKFATKVSLFLMVFSIIGIADAAYLTIKHYSDTGINCSIFNGCELITKSLYSTIFDIPVAAFGIVFYIFVFTLIFLFLKFRNKNFLFLLVAMTSIGFLISMWFIFVQGFILNLYCLYCLISAALSTGLFILSIVTVIQYNNIVNKKEELSGT